MTKQVDSGQKINHFPEFCKTTVSVAVVRIGLTLTRFTHYHHRLVVSETDELFSNEGADFSVASNEEPAEMSLPK